MGELFITFMFIKELIQKNGYNFEKKDQNEESAILLHTLSQ
jgi:hypothetical protein